MTPAALMRQARTQEARELVDALIALGVAIPTHTRYVVCWCTDGTHPPLTKSVQESPGEAAVLAERLSNRWAHVHRLIATETTVYLTEEPT